MEPPWDGGMIDCSNGPGYMISMAAMSIYGRNFKKYSSLEPKRWWPWKLVCSIGYSSSTKFVQMMTLGWHWPILRQRMLLYGKKVKQWIFQKLLLSVITNRCSQLNEYMKLYEYQRSRSFIDLGPNLSDSVLLNLFSSITNWPIEAKFHVECPWDGGT